MPMFLKLWVPPSFNISTLRIIRINSNTSKKHINLSTNDQSHETVIPDVVEKLVDNTQHEIQNDIQTRSQTQTNELSNDSTSK
jgi:hypothetical protein